MSLFKVLVVEDERILREGFATILEESGVLDVTTARTGEEGLQQLADQAFDALLLDINLPGMSGMDMLDQARMNGCEDLLVVIITGHNDFDYAQKAIELGVEEYLLKPVIPLAMRELSRRIITKLQLNEQEEYDIKFLKERVADARPVLLHALVTDLLEHTYSEAQAIQRGRFLGIELDAKRWRSILACPARTDSTDGEINRSLVMEQVYNLLDSHQWQYKSLVLYRGTEDFLILQSTDSDDAMHNEDYANIRKIQHLVKRHAGIKLIFGVGEWIAQLDTFSQSYHQSSIALATLRGSSKSTLDSCRYYREIASLPAETKTKTLDLPSVHLAFQELDLEALTTTITDLCTHIEHQAGTRQLYEICQYLYELLSLVNACDLHAIHGLGMDLTKIFGFVSRSAPHGLQAALEDITKRVLTLVEESRSHSSINLVAAVQRYVLENLESEMSLAHVARALQYSPNHLGAVFKRETGTTIHEYWHEMRIEKAKRLLKETTAYIFEIANKVGYNDQYYFSNLFKRFTGTTPRKFRDG